MECIHFGITGVKPVYEKHAFDDLLRFIWNDHNESSAWGLIKLV
jgi:hypothetical protein